MRDRLLLIVAGAACAILAWTFSRIVGGDAFLALPTIMLIVVVADNVRLRRQLRSHTRAQSSDS